MAKLQDVRYTFKNLGGATALYDSQLPGGKKQKVGQGDTVKVDISVASTLNSDKKFDLVDVAIPKKEGKKQAKEPVKTPKNPAYKK